MTSTTAVLLLGFGGPEGQDDVIPFLRNVTRGRGIPEERLEAVATHYRAFGGVSPVNSQNRALRDALQAELVRRGSGIPVYWGNRNWTPYLPDALNAAADAGHTRIRAIATSAYSSYSSCRQYREDLTAALAGTGLAASVSIEKIGPFFDLPGFVLPFVEGLERAIQDVAGRGISPAQTHIFFSTHSIPSTDAAASGPRDAGFGPGGAYVAQHLAVAEAVMAAVSAGELVGSETIASAGAVSAGSPGEMSWSLAYQSRSGRPSTPWLEPDINDAIRAAVAAGTAAVIIVPIGFVSDHMEVKWDLDNEALTTAHDLGVYAVRVATPGVHPAFVSGLVDLVLAGAPGGCCGTGCCEKALATRPQVPVQVPVRELSQP